MGLFLLFNLNLEMTCFGHEWAAGKVVFLKDDQETPASEKNGRYEYQPGFPVYFRVEGARGKFTVDVHGPSKPVRLAIKGNLVEFVLPDDGGAVGHYLVDVRVGNSKALFGSDDRKPIRGAPFKLSMGASDDHLLAASYSVRRARNGDAIAGASWYVTSADGKKVIDSGRTDGGGNFELDNLRSYKKGTLYYLVINKDIYWNNRQSEKDDSNPTELTEFPHEEGKILPSASLDNDERDGEGPECIMIRDQDKGTYTVWVTNYSNEVPFTKANAIVEFAGYKGRIAKVRGPRRMRDPEAYFWHVADVICRPGKAPTVKRVDKFQRREPHGLRAFRGTPGWSGDSSTSA